MKLLEIKKNQSKPKLLLKNIPTVLIKLQQLNICLESILSALLNDESRKLPPLCISHL